MFKKTYNIYIKIILFLLIILIFYFYFKEKIYNFNYDIYNEKNKKLKKNVLLLDSKLSSKNIFRKIINNNIKIINFIDIDLFMKKSFIILYNFPKIHINIFINNLEKINFSYLNYASTVYVKNQKMKEILDKFVYFNKPEIKITKIITFGTFDLFHIGHRNILEKCKNLSDNIVIGISTDKLNNIKGKKSFDSLNKRINNVQKFCKNSIIFKEKSLKDKDNYIKKYKSNLLVMGDDWENKFNWVSCNVLYLPRTPFISSTLLRKKLKNK